MAETLSGIKAVLCDFDDTLVGTIGPKWNQHKFIAREYYGFTLTDDDIREHWGTPFRQMVKKLYRTEDVEQALEHIRGNRADFPKVLFEGTVATLGGLKENGLSFGIVTATTRESIGFDLDMHKFPMHHVDYLQTEEDTNSHKPNPEVFIPAIKWLGERDIEPGQVVYIGDGLHDMRAAVGAGFNFIGVETGLVDGEEFRRHGALSVPKIDLVLDILR